MNICKEEYSFLKKKKKIFYSILLFQECIPQYLVGHSELLDDIDTYIQDKRLPLTLIGASYRGVSVNECMFDARKSVEKLARRLTHQPLVS